MTFKSAAMLALAGLVAGATPLGAAPPHVASRPVAAPGEPAATLRIIADALRQQGRIEYAGAMHDSSDNSDWVNHFNVEASNVTADPAHCHIGFRWTTGVDGKQVSDSDSSFDFATLQSVALTSMEQDVNRLAADGGHASWTGRVTPSIWVITATAANGSSVVADFRDYALAEQIRGAMTRAGRLCKVTSRNAK